MMNRQSWARCGARSGLLLVLTLLSACSEPGDLERADASGSAASAIADGHGRMLQLLDHIRVDTRNQNPFQGDFELRYLRETIHTGLDDMNVREAQEAVRQLGLLEVRQGDVDAAVAHLTDARDRAIRGGAPAGEVAVAWFELALAEFRRAENVNCVNCANAEGCLFPIGPGGVHQDPAPSRRAMGYLREALAAEPRMVTAAWFMNIAAMTLGEYPDGLEQRFRFPPAAFASRVSFPRFREVGRERGVATLNLLGGVVADDFDGDGDLDLLTSTYDAAVTPRYFENDGAGGFRDATDDAGLAGLYGGINMVQADYDNDGDVDVLVLRGAWMGAQGDHPNSLLRNDGAGHFVDVTFACGLGEVHRPTQTAAWADYDLDGDLDLYIGNESRPRTGNPSQLFRNDAGHFTDVAEEAGVSNLGRFAKAVSWGDFDEDGDPDIYVSNMGDANRLYRNNGDGTFDDVAEELGVTEPIKSFPAWFFDYDNDGHLDIFAAGYWADVSYVAASYLGAPTPAEAPALHRGTGGSFTNVAKEVGLDRITVPMGANFGDLDNDGFLDFYLGTGYPELSAVMPNVMYWNRAGVRFEDVSAAGGFGHLQKGHGIAFADFDEDGDQDVFCQLGGGYPVDRFGDALFENPGFQNHRLVLRLVGTKSNRSAIGTRVRAVFRDGAHGERTVFRHIGSGGSFGANPLRCHLGVGQATVIDRLEIFWPVTGETQVFEDVPVDQRLRIREGADDWEVF